jgi:MFS family permease
LLALVSRLGPDGWSWTMIGVLSAVTVLAIAFFGWHERQTSHPVLPTQVVMQRAVGPSILGSCLFGAGFLALDTYVPLYVQGARGGNATAAASVVTPVMLTWAISGTVAAPLLVRWGFRRTATLGASFIITGFTGLVICALTSAPQWMITAVLAITGFGFGPTSMSFLISAQEAVEYQQRGGVTSAISFFRTMGGAVGIGVLGALFNILVAPAMNNLRSHGIKPADLLTPHAQSSVPPELLAGAQHAIGTSLTWVFVTMLLVSTVLWGVTRLMPSRKSSHRISAREAMEAV